MTLLVTLFAAIISTVLWYRKAPQNPMRTDVLCWMFWGASLMWLVDALVAYSEQGIRVFEPDPLAMLNDFYLGLYEIAFGLMIWLAILMVKDPRRVVRKAKSKEE